MPKVSVNLPVYNGARQLRRCLDSILAQTMTDFQVIITDNASTDDTEKICREYAARDPRVAYHRNPENLGFSFSYHRGFMSSVNCDYMAYISHGDYWDPQLLEACVQPLDEDPQVVLAYSHCTFIDEDSGRTMLLYKDEFNVDSTVGPYDRYLTILGQLGMCTAYYGLIRTSVYSQLLWVHSLPFAATDNAVLAALALRGSFVQINRPLFFRERPTYGGETSGQRHRRIMKMADGDNKCAPKASVYSLPFLQHLFSHTTMLGYLIPDLADRDVLCRQTVQIMLQRYRVQMEAEVSRAVKCWADGRFYALIGDEDNPDDPAPRQGTYKALDLIQAVNVSCLFTVADTFLKNHPGLDCARALAAVILGHPDEAPPLLKRELAHNPTHRPSLELKASLAKNVDG